MIINENINVKIKKYNKLKDYIRDIVLSLKNDEWVTILELTKKLQNYNIIINDEILLKFLENWKNNKDFTIFDYDDDEWLYFDNENKVVFNILYLNKESNFGKYQKTKMDKDISNQLEQKKELRKKIIDNLEKLEDKDKQYIPIYNEIIIDTFNNLNEKDIINVKNYLYDAYINKKVEFKYDPMWFYMIYNVPKDLGLKLKLDTYKDHYPDSKWVIPKIKDLDKGVNIWYFKYGKNGIIDDVDETRGLLVIKYNNIYKRLILSKLLNNNSIRIDKNHIKPPPISDTLLPAYIKDLKINDIIYNKKENKYGNISSYIYDDNIKIKYEDTKNIKIITFDLFLKSKNYFIDKNKKTNNNIQSNNDYGIKTYLTPPDNYYKVTNFKDLEVGDNILTNNGFAKIRSISDQYLTLKGQSIIDQTYTIHWITTQIKYDNVYKEKKLKNDELSYKRINSEKDIKLNTHVKYQDDIYEIIKINKGTLTLQNQTKTVAWTITGFLKSGLYMVSKWVKPNTDNLKIGKNILVKLNNAEGVITDIDDNKIKIIINNKYNVILRKDKCIKDDMILIQD